MKPKKVITHDGIFHADEVFAIALVQEVLGPFPVERTRNISAEDMNNPNVWVIDVGGEYDYELGQFDHHQNDSLPASCMLILHHLLFINCISVDMYDELCDNFTTISNIDCKGPSLFSGFQVNSLIKSFNTLENGFDIAVNTAKYSIRAAMDTVKKSEESLEIWKKGSLIGNSIMVCDAFPIHWKRYQEANFLVYPNNGKWNVLSIDGVKFPLHPMGNEVFLHNGKFIAVYQHQTDAIDAAIYADSASEISKHY